MALLSGLLLLTTGCRFSIDSILVIWFGERPEMISLRYFLASLLTGLIIVMCLAPSRLIKDWLERRHLKLALQYQEMEAELKFLKAQVNPHFLFNALNNAYTLAYTGSQKAAPVILKLSEMMRYMLYDSQAERVSLDKELSYLKNYIELQQLKKSTRQNIHFEVASSTNTIQIPPLLFIPFFENAFKHGNIEDIEHGWVKSTLKTSRMAIDFTISNSFNPHKRKDSVGGIGLENIQQRLKLLYPQKHQLQITKHDQVFSVTLHIDLDS